MKRMNQKELCKFVSIGKDMFRAREQEIIDYLEETASLEVKVEGKRKYYYIDDTVGKITIPRKGSDLTARKLASAEEYVKQNLSKEFKPESKMHMARNYIRDEGKEKFGLNSARSVSQRYVGKAMDKLGVKSYDKVWVDYLTYRPLTAEELEVLKEVFIKKLGTTNFGGYCEDIINDDIENGTDNFSKVKEDYGEVLDEIKGRIGKRPIKVYKWKVRLGDEEDGFMDERL